MIAGYIALIGLALILAGACLIQLSAKDWVNGFIFGALATIIIWLAIIASQIKQLSVATP